jgi:transposase
MLAESHDENIIGRVAALDIGKSELVCCVRVPGTAGRKRRLQEVSTHSTMPRALSELANHLVELRIERVVMEATSTYWKPVFYVLQAHGLDPWLVNARDVKHLPGRPKTDLLTELLQGFWGGCVLRGVRLARFAARDRRWRTAAGFGGAGGAGAGWSGGDRRSVPAVSAG